MAVFNWKTSKTTSMSCLECFNALQQLQGFAATKNEVFTANTQKTSILDNLKQFSTEMASEALPQSNCN